MDSQTRAYYSKTANDTITYLEQQMEEQGEASRELKERNAWLESQFSTSVKQTRRDQKYIEWLEERFAQGERREQELRHELRDLKIDTAKRKLAYAGAEGGLIRVPAGSTSGVEAASGGQSSARADVADDASAPRLPQPWDDYVGLHLQDDSRVASRQTCGEDVASSGSPRGSLPPQAGGAGLYRDEGRQRARSTQEHASKRRAEPSPSQWADGSRASAQDFGNDFEGELLAAALERLIALVK
jgi:hypothetical protein